MMVALAESTAGSIDWFGLYLAKAIKAGCPADQFRNFVSMGLVLQHKQLLASAIARKCDRPNGPSYLGFGGARGGGKSHWLSGQVSEDCLRFAGLKALILRRAGGANRESFESFLPKVLPCVKYKYIPTAGTLQFGNGSKIFLGHYQNESDLDRYLGLEYDVIGIEEATTLSESKFKVVNASMRTSKDGWRPRLYATTNPGGVGHAWFKRRFVDPFRRKKESRSRFIPSTVDDNRFVNSEYRESLDDLTGWMLRAWRHGDWDIAIGQFFSTWSYATHVVKDVRIGLDWKVWVALDHGFVHPTWAGLFAQDNDGVVYLVDEHCRSRLLVADTAECLDGMLGRHGIPRSRLSKVVAGRDVFGTERDGGSVAKDYESHGWLLQGANVDRVNGAAEILRRLGGQALEVVRRPTVYVAERCVNLIECLPRMVHDPTCPEDVDKVNADEDGRNGDDAYDGFRYGIMEARKSPSLILGSSIDEGYRG